MKFKLIWFDSLGAKSSAVFVETDTKILIDPEASAMHPSFPASKVKKLYWREKARAEIRKYAKMNMEIASPCRKCTILLFITCHKNKILKI